MVGATACLARRARNRVWNGRTDLPNPGHTMTSAARSSVKLAIATMLIGILLFALNDVLGKWLVATYSVGQVLLIRLSLIHI